MLFGFLIFTWVFFVHKCLNKVITLDCYILVESEVKTHVEHNLPLWPQPILSSCKFSSLIMHFGLVVFAHMSSIVSSQGIFPFLCILSLFLLSYEFYCLVVRVSSLMMHFVSISSLIWALLFGCKDFFSCDAFCFYLSFHVSYVVWLRGFVVMMLLESPKLAPTLIENSPFKSTLENLGPLQISQFT